MASVALFVALGGVAWAAATINSKDVVDNSLKSVDLKDAKGVKGADVVPDSLTGNEIDESLLGEVPSAALGGLGGHPGNAYSCDPESTSFTGNCAEAQVDLPAPSRLLVIGQIRAEPDTGGGNGGGSCRVSGLPSPAPVFVNGGQTDVITISGVTGVLGPGTVSTGINCNETASGIRYFDGNVSVVALSPG